MSASNVLKIFQWVAANVTYTPEGESWDYWQCPYETLASEVGDCEDGAILLFNLLINAPGFDKTRFMVFIGTVGFTYDFGNTEGHAWVMYQRESDNAWIPLEWTNTDVVAALTSLDEVPTYRESSGTLGPYTSVYAYLTYDAFRYCTNPLIYGDGNVWFREHYLQVSASGRNAGYNVVLVIPALTVAMNPGLSINLDLPKLSFSIRGSSGVLGKAVMEFLPFYSSIVGNAGFTGIGDMTFGSITAAVTCYFDVKGNLVIELPMAELYNTGHFSTRFADYLLKHTR